MRSILKIFPHKRLFFLLQVKYFAHMCTSCMRAVIKESGTGVVYHVINVVNEWSRGSMIILYCAVLWWLSTSFVTQWFPPPLPVLQYDFCSTMTFNYMPLNSRWSFNGWHEVWRRCGNSLIFMSWSVTDMWPCMIVYASWHKPWECPCILGHFVIA